MPVQRNEQDIIQEVLSIFSTHLEKNNLRKTPERFAILEEIYKAHGPFRCRGFVHSYEKPQLPGQPCDGVQYFGIAHLL